MQSEFDTHLRKRRNWSLTVSCPALQEQQSLTPVVKIYILIPEQGSTEGEGWVDLCEHKRDPSISTPGQSVSWPVNSHAASMPYRLFRVLLRAPTAGLAGNNKTFHLSLFDLYGHFFRIL